MQTFFCQNEYTWYTDEIRRWTNLGGIEALLGHAAAEQSRAGALEGVLSNEDKCVLPGARRASCFFGEHAAKRVLNLLS